MIDFQARSRLAEVSRWLVSGLITNYEYDDRVVSDDRLVASKDPAVREIYSKGFWLLYDDLRQYRFKERYKIPPQTRKVAARCIFFLKSGLPYNWPVLSRSAAFLLTVANLVTLGAAGFAYARWARRGRDISYWPFASAAQYNDGLQSPIYLSGAKL